jgi:septum formation topological specificity factor MinE
MENRKNEFLQAIFHYRAIDTSEVKNQLTQDGRSHGLVADVPLKDGTQMRLD